MRSEVRLGYDEADVRIRRRVGARPSCRKRTARTAWPRCAGCSTDRTAHSCRHAACACAPRCATTSTLPRLSARTTPSWATARDVPQGEVVASWFRRVGTRQRLFLAGGGGTSFDHSPGINQFRLGGPFRIGSLNLDEIHGDSYVLGTVGLLHEWFRLPDVLGGNVYIGGWLEQGSVFNPRQDDKYNGSLSGWRRARNTLRAGLPRLQPVAERRRRALLHRRRASPALIRRRQRREARRHDILPQDSGRPGGRGRHRVWCWASSSPRCRSSRTASSGCCR